MSLMWLHYIRTIFILVQLKCPTGGNQCIGLSLVALAEDVAESEFYMGINCGSPEFRQRVRGYNNMHRDINQVTLFLQERAITLSTEQGYLDQLIQDIQVAHEGDHLRG